MIESTHQLAALRAMTVEIMTVYHRLIPQYLVRILVAWIIPVTQFTRITMLLNLTIVVKVILKLLAHKLKFA